MGLKFNGKSMLPSASLLKMWTIPEGLFIKKYKQEVTAFVLLFKTVESDAEMTGNI